VAGVFKRFTDLERSPARGTVPDVPGQNLADRKASIDAK
jgi:hypothetical protein